MSRMPATGDCVADSRLQAVGPIQRRLVLAIAVGQLKHHHVAVVDAVGVAQNRRVVVADVAGED